jgi:outer membrane protein OmpA-like peptidoglycan-associated protein
MKKNTIKLFLIWVIGVLITAPLVAQQDLTLYNMEVVPQRMYANPAFFPSYSKVNIGLPLISSDYITLSNSGFKYSDLVRRRADDSLYIDYDNMLKKLGKNNYISSSVRIDLLSFGFAVKKNYFSFNATEKVDVRFGYSKAFMTFLGKGNGATLGEAQDFNFSLNATHYREYGFGYSRKINDKLTVGGKVKYLYGMENISTQNADLTLTTDPNDFTVSAKTNLIIRSAGLDTASLNGISKDPSAYLLKRKNNGMGIDLGGTYKLTEKISLSASMIDLGFIKWKNVNNSNTITKSNGSFQYRGVDLNDFLGKNDTSSSSLQKVADTLQNNLHLDTTHATYTTRLATQIFLGGNYNFTEKANAGVLFYGQFFDKKIHPALALSFNQRLGRWLNYSVSYSMYNRSYNNIGLGLGLNLGPVQLYMVSDNVLGAIVPQNTKNLHLHFGINLTFGRKLDKDKDGISDKKDKCPEMPGIKEFDGCPDKDHDHIADKDDMCPNDSGSIELKGCPDRDHDKIMDLTDSCPDIAGLVEFNGCPDKDGDKIIDKKDACPDEAGTLEMKGCPDKDGDKVIDKEDACPDKPGPETNKGCPEKTLNLINSKGDVIGSSTSRKDGSYAFDNLPPDAEAMFKLVNTTDTNVAEVKVVSAGVVKMAYKDFTGIYRFKTEVPKPANAPQVAVKLEEKEAEILKKAFNNLEFNSGKDVIKNESLSSLDELAGLLAKKPTWNLKVSGHTDNVGNPKINLALSQKRAEAVKKYLVSKGIAANRFKVEWFGGNKPIATNKTEAGRQQNRRVEMMITE